MILKYLGVDLGECVCEGGRDDRVLKEGRKKVRERKGERK